MRGGWEEYVKVGGDCGTEKDGKDERRGGEEGRSGKEDTEIVESQLR